MTATLILSCCRGEFDTCHNPLINTLDHNYFAYGSHRLGIFKIGGDSFLFELWGSRLFLNCQNGLRNPCDDWIPYLSADLDNDPQHKAMGEADCKEFPFDFFGKLLAMI